MPEYQDNHEHSTGDDGSPTPRTRREPRKGIDINELPVWTWVGILMGVVVIGWGLWMMTHSGADKATPETTATVAPTVQPTVAGPQVQPQATAPAAGVEPTPTVVVPATAAPVSGELSVGRRVTVSGTGADKLRVRAGPGTDFATMLIVSDGTEFTVLEGPQSQGGYEWWRLEMADGTTGWAVGTYLVPVGN